ncbi:hypothetical protein JCM10003_1473 [Bacteroides pyogenes JCM 10003]|nr:hypothetical protein JCM10003_1473 [Bacteroides pyogenes JCM 10003]
MWVDRGANAQGHHHKSDLGNGGKGQYAFDVRLDTGYARRIESGERSYPGYDVQRVGA